MAAFCLHRCTHYIVVVVLEDIYVCDHLGGHFRPLQNKSTRPNTYIRQIPPPPPNDFQ